MAQSPDQPAFLIAKGLRQEFRARDGKPVVALQHISLDIRRGEFLSILGPSGCGKSTLLQILAGLIAPSAGEVVLDGRQVVAPPRDMVYLFQQYSKSLFPWMTVIQNVEFALDDRTRSRAERRDICREQLRLVGLRGFDDHYPWQLSGGMQQRVAIARALAAKPKVLLLDEPLSAVDALTRLELQSLILQIWAETGLTVILVTHDVDEAVFMSQRVVMLSKSPSTISRMTDIDLPHPRDPVTTREEKSFLSLRHELLELLIKRPVVSADA